MTLEVDTGAMRTHAAEVDELAGRLEGALDAGAATALRVDAFGFFCSFLVPFTSSVQLAGVAALATSAASMTGVASGLRSSADAYDLVDEVTHGALSEFVAGLPS